MIGNNGRAAVHLILMCIEREGQRNYTDAETRMSYERRERERQRGLILIRRMDSGLARERR